MRLKELLLNFSFPFNNWYNSKEWYLLIRNDLPRVLRVWHGNREILDSYMDKKGELTPEGVFEIKETIDLMFMANSWKYDHLYGIYTAEYNPIWNYDGSETREYREDYSDSKTGYDESTNSGKDTNVKSGYQDNNKTGYSEVTRSGSESHGKTGTETNVQTGSIKDQNGGKLQNARTTFDSATGLNTDSTTDTTETTTTFNSKSDALTYNTTETDSFTNRKDKTDYQNIKDTLTYHDVKDELTHGKKVKDEYHSGANGYKNSTETLTRGGNQGTTTTQAMANEELELAGKLKLLQTIALDLVNTICYS